MAGVASPFILWGWGSDKDPTLVSSFSRPGIIQPLSISRRHTSLFHNIYEMVQRVKDCPMAEQRLNFGKTLAQQYPSGT